jgi:hypothetical protein
MSDSTDGDILARIQQMMRDEHELRSDLQHSGDQDSDRERLAGLEEQLDQCWDLLRQRRAAREFGQDPASAQVRPVDQVEGYLS